MTLQQYFLSYSRTDAEMALKLAHDLKAANVSIWIDQLDIEAGGIWDASIEKALGECNGLLFIASKTSVTSSNALNEVHYAIREKKSVIPVRIDDCKIPLLMIRHNYIDLFIDYQKGFLQLLNRLSARAEDLSIASTTDNRRVTEESGSRVPVDEKSLGPLQTKAKSRRRLLVAMFTGVVIIAAVLFLWLAKNDNSGAGAVQNETVPSGVPNKDTTTQSSSAAADSLYEAGQEHYERKKFFAAFENFREAAQQGNISAMFESGNLYTNGEGVKRDHQAAMKWYQKAAQQGHVIAMYYLADLYENGLGVTVDFNQAMQWYTRAADGGYKHAYANVGDLYFEGKGVAVNYQKALEWYQKAADAGEPNGTHSLAEMYDNGVGVEINKTKAKELYQKAKNLGYTEEEQTGNH